LPSDPLQVGFFINQSYIVFLIKPRNFSDHGPTEKYQPDTDRQWGPLFQSRPAQIPQECHMLDGGGPFLDNRLRPRWQGGSAESDRHADN
jgi:hypothetical protein